MKRRRISLVAALALIQFVAAGAAAAAEAVVSGIRVGFTLMAVGSDVPGGIREAAFTFTLATEQTGAPVRGATPAAWLVPRTSGTGLDARQCRQTAAAFVRGGNLAVPAVDLNTFYVLALGGDATISVIDPRIGFGGSRLIGLVSLDANAVDWALTPDQATLVAAQPSIDRIAIVDTRTWRIKDTVAVPRAARVAVTPDGRHALVSYSSGDAADSGVALVDVTIATNAAPPRIPTGVGPHDIAIDPEGRFGFVSNAGADSVSVIDLAARQAIASVPAGRRPVALAYSPLARRAYAAAEDGRVTVIDPARPTAAMTIAGPPGITALRFAPGGRFLLAPSPQAGQVAVIDAATDRIVQRIEVAGEPDAIGFSDRMVYVRRRASAFVDAFPLDQIGVEGHAPSALTVGIGQLALGAVTAPARADAMAPAPGGDGVVIANPGERAIYYYREGMAAPSGSLSTYRREPRAVLIVDRRLRESGPGAYSTFARLPRAGTYDVVLYVDAPRIVQCFEVRIDPKAAGEDAAATPLVTDVVMTGAARTGERLGLRFRLIDPQTGTPMDDVRDAAVVSFAIPGQNRARNGARPLGGGAYQADITAPEPGTYYVFVEAPSVALAPAAGRIVEVVPGARP